MESADLNHPRVWAHYFAEAGPIEFYQWIFLGLSVLAAIYTGSKLINANEHSLGYMWLSLGVFFLILLVEDTGNTSHQIAEYMSIVFAGNRILSSRRIVYLAYMVIGILPLVIYSKHIIKLKQFSGSLLVAYGVYGFAGIQSAFDFSRIRFNLGDIAVNRLFNGTLRYEMPEGLWPVEYKFADSILEESLELFSAMAIFGTIVVFTREYYKKHEA